MALRFARIIRRFLPPGAAQIGQTRISLQPEKSNIRPFHAFAFALGGLSLLALCMGCGSDVHLGLDGAVSSTQNPQVAAYTITPLSPATVTVSFGQTTNYGFKTGSQPTPRGGGPVRIYVAGMLANTTYHMRATVQYGDGTTVTDSDHTFTTGSYPAADLPQITASTASGQTPQPGIEMLNPFDGHQIQILATNLSGKVIWAYDSPDNLGTSNWFAPKQLPNGDFIALLAPNSPDQTTIVVPPGGLNLVREFDLAGNTVKQITMTQLNAELAAANYNVTLQAFHHEVTPLPNGHWLILANTLKSVVLAGSTTPIKVSGDVVVDLDTNLKPVWVWNEFDHLDINRHPYLFPDWTHTNAIVYSPSDGNIIVSMRHQNWVVKVDYNNGAGTGNIIWHLGEGGDFKLIGGTDPTDWQYAQHGPSFTTMNSSGIFGLTLMDNGDDRQYPGGPVGVTCGGPGGHACYSTIPVFQINDVAKTATLLFHQIVPANLYSFFGGNSEALANGDIEYDLCGLGAIGETPQSAPASEVFEVTNDVNPQTVWTLKSTGFYLYRAYRLPSLYAGVQW